jgi:hypothetical protein
MEIIKMNFLNKTMRKSMRNRLGLYLTTLLMIASINIASSQCSGISMTCNTGLQLSLNSIATGCVFVVTPDVMLENPNFPDNEYTVEITDENGNVIPNATLDASHIGMDLSVKVTLDMCGLACWGNITIEDKLPPVLACVNQVIDCTDNSEPQSATNPMGIPQPTVFDCSAFTLIHEDITGPLNCGGSFGQRINRFWIATDEHGNMASCTQLIDINLATIAGVMIPPDLDLDCDDPIIDLPDFPMPSVTGMPTGLGCDNILVEYSDNELETCGAGKKILRSWLIVDWCTGDQLNGLQVIKIEDTTAPNITCPADSDVPSNFGCAAPGTLEYVISIYIEADPGCQSTTYSNALPPIVRSECSEYTYTIAYLFGVNGQEPALGTPFETANTVQTGTDANGLPVYSISGFPVGPSWLRYTVTDDCGFQTDCFTAVYVYDVTSPNAICEGGTVITVADGECKTIMASSLDDGSFDSCGDVTFQISRNGNNYSDSVEFCCSDANNSDNTVYLLVTDECGNTSVCSGTVTVEDVAAPTINCPADAEVACDSSTEPSVTGMPTFTGNCTNPSVTHSDGPLQDENCNTGFFIRTWTATSSNGQTASCTQTITIVSDDPLTESDIVWGPATINLTECITSQPTDPNIIGGGPTVNNDSDCVDIGITFEDMQVSGSGSFCVSIIRTWKVVDWCSFGPMDPLEFFEFTQTINITGGDAPVFANCDDVVISDDIDDCQGVINITQVATDDCTTNIDYTWTIDIYNDGSVDDSGNGNTINGTYPSGTHKVTFTATDDCDNEGMCMFMVTIDDESTPTPICFAELALPLGSNGQTVIWANDFDIKSEDTCDPSDMLVFSFTEDGNTPSMTFTCADLPNGIGESFPLEVHVIDTDGNSQFCIVTAVIQDTDDVCTDVNNAAARVSGQVHSEDGQMVEDVEVELLNTTDNNMTMDMTDQTGDYAFNTVDYYDAYAISPAKNTDPLNGVSTLDLVLIQKHILKTDTLDSPYKLIAADINASENISATDLIELRKLILGVYTDFPNNDPFVFVEEGFEFVIPTEPWNYDSTIDISALFVDENDADFIAIKIGDVNESAVYNNATATSTNRSASTASLELDDQYFTAGQEVSVTLALDEHMELYGFQYQLETNEMLDFVKAESTSLKGFSSANYAIQEDGVAFSYNQNQAEDTTGELVLNFIALSDGYLSEALSLSKNGLHAEAYNADLEVMDMELNVRSVLSKDENFVLYQNRPNPFNELTQISFFTKSAEAYQMEVIDLTGKLVQKIAKISETGLNIISLDQTQLTGTGVYYYRLTIGNKVETKKMILMK